MGDHRQCVHCAYDGSPRRFYLDLLQWFEPGFLAAAVIVPISWPTHLLAQAVCLTYYYGLNFLHPIDSAGINAAIENFFFLIWTCVALLFSVSSMSDYNALISGATI